MMWFIKGIVPCDTALAPRVVLVVQLGLCGSGISFDIHPTHTTPQAMSPSVPFLSDAFSFDLKLEYLADSLVCFAIHFGTFCF